MWKKSHIAQGKNGFASPQKPFLVQVGKMVRQQGVLNCLFRNAGVHLQPPVPVANPQVLVQHGDTEVDHIEGLRKDHQDLLGRN
ncbi:MAG: hypothetical protein SVV67_11060, partial [Bacillota bacterium]|nr:hypothetical protein [Bacillota bacterium]